MAKSKEKKPRAKPPENAKSVIEIRKVIETRKAQLTKIREKATKDGKINRGDTNYRHALKLLKRAQRKLYTEAERIGRHVPKEEAAPAAAAPAAEAKPA